MSFERAKESAIYVLAGLLNDIAEGFYKTSIIPCLVGISTNQGYFVLQSVLAFWNISLKTCLATSVFLASQGRRGSGGWGECGVEGLA